MPHDRLQCSFQLNVSKTIRSTEHNIQQEKKVPALGLNVYVPKERHLP